MNLDRAFVLLFASIGAVAGFTPSGRTAFSVASSHSSCVSFAPRASALFSEVEQAAEATQTVASASSSEEPAAKSAFDSSIYVGNISFDTRESDIMDAFSAHGSVSKVQVPTDRNTGRARGFAFVTMSNAEEHAAAIAALNESQLGGRTIYVNESLPKDKVAEKKKRDPKKTYESSGTKIYVGNLNFDTTMEEVRAAFAKYGEVKDCFVPSDYDGNPRGFAFVTLDDDNALKAIEGLDGTELGGRTLNVKKSLPKGTNAKTDAKGKSQIRAGGSISMVSILPTWTNYFRHFPRLFLQRSNSMLEIYHGALKREHFVNYLRSTEKWLIAIFRLIRRLVSIVDLLS
ncbi:hypothetical protein ACHAW5_007724 [Stephanodiscus triporus]|uniref:RRM domain-containing protein n=1 Tax=Stephanodiscus triporus TaxID=2934178 RepID=A0ABD3PQK7_9STRA